MVLTNWFQPNGLTNYPGVIDSMLQTHDTVLIGSFSIANSFLFLNFKSVHTCTNFSSV